MTLEELLDELRANILRDDAVLASGPSDQLWSDDALVRYINDAQTQWSRRTLALRDASTSSVVDVTLGAGVSTYDLHKSVLSVISARIDGRSTDLLRVGRSAFATLYNLDAPFFDPSRVDTLTPGEPKAFGTDESLSMDDPSAVRLTVYPEPTATEDGMLVKLRVARMPLDVFTIDKPSAKCELPEEHQLDMLEWAAFRAQRNSDIDGHSDMADKHKSQFNDAADRTLRDLRRKLFAPTRFAFGSGGYSWER